MKALIHISERYGVDPHMLKAVETVNGHKKEVLFKKIYQYFQGQLKGKTFALWGLAFKPNTNDIREASSCVLMQSLWQAGASVRAFDPAAMEEIRQAYPKELTSMLHLCNTKEQCLENADALIICTEWAEFCNARLEEIRVVLKKPVIFDGRNIFNLEHAKTLGFDYFGIGR